MAPTSSLSTPTQLTEDDAAAGTGSSVRHRIPRILRFHRVPLAILLNPIIILLAALCNSLESECSLYPAPPPLPILPIPTSRQIQWQLAEMAIFLHFGTNTFTDREWGTGEADPSVFNPVSLNASQWVSVAKEFGFSRLILTAKHHDGFCLWPSEYTDYSVKSSPWKNGYGDVVKELADAAGLFGVELGIYLSPWDRHEPCYGKTLEYNEFYLGQMTELLMRYGEISEVFLDEAKGEGEKDMEYLFPLWFRLIHQLQPQAIIFSDSGPDTRWVGDEAGAAGTTCWSLFNASTSQFDFQNSNEGDPFGQDWIPATCDVSIRPGWFWHPSEAPKSAITLLDIYYKSVGRNCLLLLNVPPNSSGLISDEDILVLQEFSQLRNTIFGVNLAENATVSASSTRGDPVETLYSPNNVLLKGIYLYWAPEPDDASSKNWSLCLDFEKEITFNVLLVQEPIQMGQRIIEFHLDIFNDIAKDWQLVTNGTTVGYKRLLLFQTVKATRVRLVVDKSRSIPLISYIGLYMDSFSDFRHGWASNSSSSSITLHQTADKRNPI